MVKLIVLRSETDVMCIRREIIESAGVLALIVEAKRRNTQLLPPTFKPGIAAGYVFSSASPCGLSLLDGMTLPGNGSAGERVRDGLRSC